MPLVLQARSEAKVREGYEQDSLATLQDPGLLIPTNQFKYSDRYQHAQILPDANRYANSLTDSEQVGSVTVQYNKEYDRLAIGDLKTLSVTPTPANFLLYNDVIGPLKATK